MLGEPQELSSIDPDCRFILWFLKIFSGLSAPTPMFLEIANPFWGELMPLLDSYRKIGPFIEFCKVFEKPPICLRLDLVVVFIDKLFLL